MREIECRKVVGFLFFLIVSVLLINDVSPFFLFIKTLISALDVLVWPIFFAIVIYAARDFLQSDQKDEHSDLTTDNAQANKILELYKNKCKGRKALMITAPWGLGKTSFYKASLKQIFKSKFSNSEPVAVSCFGLSSQDELIMQILNELFRMEAFSILISRVKQILSSSSHFKRALIPQGSIIVIDDFERFSGEYAILMGLFNYLIQQKKCHIIILCNEEKVEKQPYYKQYHDLSEKIIVKHHFEMTPEQMKEIMRSKEFTFNNEPHYFSEPIIEQFIGIVDVTKNFRTAWDAHKDLIEISRQLVKRLKEVNIPQEKKEAGLRIYFGEACAGVIKATFIKNEHKTIQYFLYQNKVKGNGNKAEIEDDFLRKIGSIKLINDVCVSGSYLALPEAMISYLRGAELYDETFINETVIHFILIPLVHQEIDSCLDNSNGYIDDIKAIENLMSIKESFFTFFRFIQQFPRIQPDCSGFVYYRIFSLRYNINLNKEEEALVEYIEDKLTKLKIAETIKNILGRITIMHPPDGFIRKVDSDGNFLKQLFDSEYKDV